MPIIGTDEDQEGLDPNQQTHGAAPYAPGGVTPSGGSAGFVGGGTGTGATTSAAPAAGGSGSTATPGGAAGGSSYTNLLSYLGANQGAGSTMGGALNDVATGVGSQAKGDVDSYQSGAMKDAQNATVNVDPTKVAKGTAVDQGIMGQIAGGVTGGGVTKTTNADGSVTTNTAAKTYNGPTPPSIADPTQQNVSYSGPTDSQHQTGDTATAQTSAYGDLARLAGYGQNAAGGTAGNAALLGNLYRQPSYTKGEQTFDAAVLGGTSGGQQALGQIGQTAATGKAYGDAADTAVNAADTAAQQTTANTAKTYTDAYNQATAMNAATRKAYGDAIDKAKQGQTAALSFTTAAPAVATPAAPTAVNNNKGSGVSQLGKALDPSQLDPSTSAGRGSISSAGSPITLPGTPQSVGQQVINDVSNAPSAVSSGISNATGWAHKRYADGGIVGDDDDDSNEKSGSGGGGAGGLAQTAGKLAPLVMMLMKDGGPVPGTAVVSGDSPKNDRVPALLSAEEVVLPRSVTLAKDAPKKAEKFVKNLKDEPKHGRYGALVKLCSGGR